MASEVNGNSVCLIGVLGREADKVLFKGEKV